MAPPDSAASGRGAWALGSLIIALTLLEQGYSIHQELLPPRDLNAAWVDLPRWVAALPTGFALADLARLGAWLNASVAGCLVLFGRNVQVFQGVTGLWVALTLLAIFGLTRSVRALALAAQLPVLVVLPRGGWIHSPETALALVGAWVVASGRRTWPAMLGLMGLGGALVLLRPSGLLWVFVLVLALLPTWRHPRVWATYAVWAIASLPALGELVTYARGKVAMVDRYALTVPDIPTQLPVHLGWAGALFVGLGLLAGLVPKLRRPSPVRSVYLAAWVVLPLLASLVTGAGLDNFPLFFAALVLLADRVPQHRMLTGVVVVGWLLTTGVRAANAWSAGIEASARERVVSLLEESCPDRGPGRACVVIVDQGLFHPFTESDTLELFLAGEDHVRMIRLHAAARAPSNATSPDALVTWDCGARNAIWRQRFPTNDQDRSRMVRRLGFLPSHRLRAEGCELVWLTPRVARSE